MAAPRLGIIIADERALRAARSDDPVDLVILRSTLVNPPRAAGATKLRSRFRELHPNAEVYPYIWHLVSHGPTDGLRDLGSRSLPGDPRAFGHLQDTPEVRGAWESTLRCATAMESTTVVLRTPASFTPGGIYRARLRRFVAERAAEGLHVVWEAEGLWEPPSTLAVARELDMTTIVPAFDGTGRPFSGSLERRWLRVDGAGPTTHLRPALADSLLLALDARDEEATILFGGPRGYANLRAFAKAIDNF